MTYHVRLTLTAAAVFGLFVYGEKLLLNHKMSESRLRLGQMFTFRTISQPRACITQYNISRKWFIHKVQYSIAQHSIA